MNCLAYLLRTTLKNKVKDILRSPAKLILVVMLILMMGVSLLSASGGALGTHRDFSELSALIFAFYSAAFVIVLLRGFDSGASFFSMADVQVLFLTPTSQIRVLFYGLIRQAGISLFLGFFLLFQYGWVNQAYGISFLDMVWILIGYGICLFCANLTAMAIYSFTSARESGRRIGKLAVLLILCGYGVYILLPAFTSGDFLPSVTGQIGTLPVSWFPVSGWLKSAAVNLICANPLQTVVWLIPILIFIGAILILIVKGQPDFYEDVLQATSVSQSVLAARKEGQMVDLPVGRVKTGKTGLHKGWGSSAFFHKHMLEDRRGRKLLLDRNNIIFLLMTLVFAWFFRKGGIVGMFVFSTYLQIFTVAAGRWAKELTLPYAYLIPEKSFRKLIFLCMEGVLKTVVESVILFVLAALIIDMPVDLIVSCILARVGFGLLFMSGNILLARIFGSTDSKSLRMLFYFFGMVFLCVPGVILGVFVGILVNMVIPIGFSVSFLIIFLWNGGGALLILFLCRGLLDNGE